MGQIKNWKDVGGSDAPSEVYGRDRESGTFETSSERVISKEPPAAFSEGSVPQDHQLGSSNLIVESVGRSPNAIGYVSSPLIKGTKALAISDGSGPAIYPTELSIVVEEYRICGVLVLYAWDAPGANTDAFIRYAAYTPGQDLLTRTPFVELTPRVFPVKPPSDAPVTYKRIASKYSRIGLRFHFSGEQAGTGEDGTGELDNLASVNLLRLRTFLAQHYGTGSDILLLRFDDGEEGDAAGTELAHDRAEGVSPACERSE